MPGEKVIEVLSMLSPVSRELAQLLRVPADAVPIGECSFSTDSTAASSLEGCFLVGLPLPKNIPDYAIALSGRNCILVDMRRRIAVMGEASKEGGWVGFEMNLQKALEVAPREGQVLLVNDELEKFVKSS
jgi:hypothetical protein